MKAASLLVAALENEGVKQIFGVPGEENLDVVEALRRSAIKLVRDAPRAGGGLHGRDAWPADRRGWRLPFDAGSGRAQSDDGRRLRPARRDADGHDHGPERRPQPQAGALSGRRHRLDDDAADQDGASDRQPGDHPRRWCARRSGSRSRSDRARSISNCRRISPRRRRPRFRPCRPTRSRCRSRHPAALDRAARPDPARPSARW